MKKIFPSRKISPKEAIEKADRLCKKLRGMTLPPEHENMDLEVWRA